MPSAETAIRHVEAGGQVGVVPWSLRQTCLDVDHGNPADLRRTIGRPRAVLDSRSRKGAHNYFDDTEPRSNSQFDIGGCQGDIRGAGGYVVIHGDQFGRLLDGMRRSGRFMLQTDLFEYLIEEGRKQAADTPQVAGDRRITKPVPLAQARPGNRNVSLFEAARRNIYPRAVLPDLDDWADYCRHLVGELSKQIPDKTGFEADVFKIAYSIATWTFDRAGVILDHSLEAQFRRGVKRHYGDASKARVQHLLDRNGEIVDLYDAGWTQSMIAERVGMSQRGVSGILRKAAAYGREVERMSITAASPWKAAGVSRATWYRRQ